MNQYPKWLYHRTNPPVIVNNPDDHKALGDGWAESPADLDAEYAPVKKGRKNANG
jgi:hypothetical protein